MLNDLQSTNGTTLNGAPSRQQPLSDGDEIRIGEAVLTYRGPADAPPGAALPGLPSLPNPGPRG